MLTLHVYLTITVIDVRREERRVNNRSFLVLVISKSQSWILSLSYEIATRAVSP